MWERNPPTLTVPSAREPLRPANPDAGRAGAISPTGATELAVHKAPQAAGVGVLQLGRE